MKRVSLQVYTLGTFSVERGETPITDSEWKTQKNKTLIKILLTHRGHALTKDQRINCSNGSGRRAMLRPPGVTCALLSADHARSWSRAYLAILNLLSY